MFFPKAMSELELIVPSKDLLGVMKILSGHGIFHQSDSNYPAPETEAGCPNTWQEKASAYASPGTAGPERAANPGIRRKPPASTDFQDSLDPEIIAPGLEGIEAEVKKTSDQLAEERKRLEQLESTLRQLEPVADINLDISSLRNSHYLYSTLGVMPAANVGRLQTSLARVPHVFLTLRA